MPVTMSNAGGRGSGTPVSGHPEMTPAPQAPWEAPPERTNTLGAVVKLPAQLGGSCEAAYGQPTTSGSGSMQLGQVLRSKQAEQPEKHAIKQTTTPRRILAPIGSSSPIYPTSTRAAPPPLAGPPCRNPV